MDERPDQVRGQGVPDEGVRSKLSRERAEINPNPARTDDELEELRLELARTRAQMSETVYAIQERMSPQYMREQATSQARDTARQAGSSITETIKNNPVPAALTGVGLVGLGWLAASGSSSGSSGRQDYRESSRYYGSTGGYGSTERYDSIERYGSSGVYGSTEESPYPAYSEGREAEGSSGGSRGEQARETAGQAREKAGQVGSQIQDRARGTGEQAQQQAQRAKGGFQRTLQENPLALGALAVGLGAAVGFSLPGTSKEDEVMGETRDSLVERGKQAAREQRQSAQRVLEEGRRSAEEEARRQDLTSQ